MAEKTGHVLQIAARDVLIEKLKTEADVSKAASTTAVSARIEMERKVISLREASATEKICYTFMCPKHLG